MVRLVLYHGFNQHEIEYDPSDGLETLFFQVFSLTNVAPEVQRLFGIEAGPISLAALPPDAVIRDGMAIALLEPMISLTVGACAALPRLSSVCVQKLRPTTQNAPYAPLCLAIIPVKIIMTCMIFVCFSSGRTRCT